METIFRHGIGDIPAEGQACSGNWMKTNLDCSLIAMQLNYETEYYLTLLPKGGEIDLLLLCNDCDALTLVVLTDSSMQPPTTELLDTGTQGDIGRL